MGTVKRRYLVALLKVDHEDVVVSEQPRTLLPRQKTQKDFILENQESLRKEIMANRKMLEVLINKLNALDGSGGVNKKREITEGGNAGSGNREITEDAAAIPEGG